MPGRFRLTGSPPPGEEYAPAAEPHQDGDRQGPGHRTVLSAAFHGVPERLRNTWSQVGRRPLGRVPLGSSRATEPGRSDTASETAAPMASPRPGSLVSPPALLIESREQAAQRMDDASKAAMTRCIDHVIRACARVPSRDRYEKLTFCGGAVEFLADTLAVGGARPINGRPRLHGTGELIDRLERHGVEDGEERTLLLCHNLEHSFAIACVGSRAAVMQAYVGTYSLSDWMTGAGALGDSPLSPKRGPISTKALAAILRDLGQGLRASSPEVSATALRTLFCAPESLQDRWVSMFDGQGVDGIDGMGLRWHEDPLSQSVDYEHLSNRDLAGRIDDWVFR